MKPHKRAPLVIQQLIAFRHAQFLSLLAGSFVLLSCAPRSPAPTLTVPSKAPPIQTTKSGEPAEDIRPEVASTDEMEKIESQPEEIPEQASDEAEKMAEELAKQASELEEAAKASSMEVEASPDEMNSAANVEKAEAAKAQPAAAQNQAAATNNAVQTVRLYRFAVSSNNVNFCLDIANKSRQVGAGLAYLQCDNTLSQFFAAQPFNGTYFRMVNANSGLCLTNTGAALVQAGCTAAVSASQLFRFPPSQAGGFFIGTYAGTCLTLNGQCVRNGIFASDFTVKK